jgi:uncharacterized protein
MELRDNAELDRFEMDVNGDVAYLEYRRNDNRLLLKHTEVPVALRGRGAGTRLVKAVLDRARADGVVVIAHCPFVKAYLTRHPEYESLTRSRPT